MICLKPFRFRPLVSHDRNPHEIKVVYDHTRIASYRHLRVGNIGKHVRLLALDGGRIHTSWGLAKVPYSALPVQNTYQGLSNHTTFRPI
jgi:hypothetical protein